MHKEWVYKDVLVDHYMTEAEFYYNLTNKLDKLLQKLNSGLYNEVANAVSVMDFSRYYAGRLIGTHNVVLPAYSPFLEGNYLRLMLQTCYELKKYHRVHQAILGEVNPSVSAIMTSHGYTAAPDSQGGPTVLRRFGDCCKSLARQTIYGLGLFGVKKLLQHAFLKPTQPIEEVQRSYWVDEVNRTWSDNMEIFELIDRDKLHTVFANTQRVPELKAKLIYLDRIINECRVAL